ncbi:hypothetical protein [Hahella ganghwensis]|uniref:hypothetical protein n=1 Tax=Hahella ganghwensis TaxID=286420 RepID=UPI00037911C2|nr:hypothetical protein [Hahella ganghwensis]
MELRAARIYPSEFRALLSPLVDSETPEILEESLSFVPKNGASYVVKGFLNNNFSSVWLEDEQGKIVSDILHIKREEFTEDVIEKVHLKVNGSRVALFAGINREETSDFVIKKLGEPDEVLEVQLSEREYPKLIQYHRYHDLPWPTQTVYQYNDLGSVYFWKSDEGHLTVANVKR